MNDIIENNQVKIEDILQDDLIEQDLQASEEVISENIVVSEEEESIEEEGEEFIPTEQLESIVESMLFATTKPLGIAAMKQAFLGTSVSSRQIKKALDALAIEYASVQRGVTLEEVSGGYQLRTKVDNMDYLKRMIKARSFRLSGPALEVMSIVAYKQPVIKLEIDEIRGVESGHLVRALMDKGLVTFAGKSELPGKPMLYATTRKFLEIFGLKGLKELPTLSEIDELLPEGIEVSDDRDPVLGDLTEGLSKDVNSSSYSEGEEELLTITSKLSDIDTSSEFFEQEKQRERERRDRDRAKDIEDAIAVGEEIETKDQRWLTRYQAKMAEELLAQDDAEIEEESLKASESSVESASKETEKVTAAGTIVEAIEESATDDEISLELAEMDALGEEEASEERVEV